MRCDFPELAQAQAPGCIFLSFRFCSMLFFASLRHLRPRFARLPFGLAALGASAPKAANSGHNNLAFGIHRRAVGRDKRSASHHLGLATYRKD